MKRGEQSEGSIIDERSFLEYDDVSLGGIPSSRYDQNVFKREGSLTQPGKKLEKSPQRDELDPRVRQNLAKYEFNY